MVEKSINMAFLMSLVLKIIYKATTPRKIKLLNLAEIDNDKAIVHIKIGIFDLVKTLRDKLLKNQINYQKSNQLLKVLKSSR